MTILIIAAVAAMLGYGYIVWDLHAARSKAATERAEAAEADVKRLSTMLASDRADTRTIRDACTRAIRERDQANANLKLATSLKAEDAEFMSSHAWLPTLVGTRTDVLAAIDNLQVGQLLDFAHYDGSPIGAEALVETGLASVVPISAKKRAKR